MDRDDVLRMRGIRLQLVTERSDVDVDGARDRCRIVAPDLVEEHLAGEYRAAMLDEIAQQLELERRQVDLPRAAHDVRTAKVDTHVTKGVALCRRLGDLAHAAQQRLDPRE